MLARPRLLLSWTRKKREMERRCLRQANHQPVSCFKDQPAREEERRQQRPGETEWPRKKKCQCWILSRGTVKHSHQVRYYHQSLMLRSTEMPINSLQLVFCVFFLMALESVQLEEVTEKCTSALQPPTSVGMQHQCVFQFKSSQINSFLFRYGREARNLSDKTVITQRDESRTVHASQQMCV